MCFRFQQAWPTEEDDAQRDIETLMGMLYGIEEIPAEYKRASNIALTDPALVITNEIPRRAEMQRFSIIPYYASSPKQVAPGPNANATMEKVATSPTWKQKFEQRRCLIPVSGFYDWLHLSKDNKVPYKAYVPGEPMFSLAGIWDTWTNRATGEVVRGFAIITSPPNELWGKIHDRMPVILKPEAYENWLSPATSPKDAYSLLEIFPAEKMAYREFSKAMSRNTNKNEEEMVSVGVPVTV